MTMAKKNKKLNGCYHSHGCWYRKVSVPLGNKKYKQVTFAIGRNLTMEEVEFNNNEINTRIDIIQIKGNNYIPTWLSKTNQARILNNEFSFLATKFLNDKRLERKSEKTIEIYGDAFKHLMELHKLFVNTDWCPEFNLTQLNSDHCRDILKYYNYRIDLKVVERHNGCLITPITKHTANCRLRSIKAFFKWLEYEEIINRCPKLDMFAVDDPTPSYLTTNQMLLIEHFIRENYIRDYNFLVWRVIKFYLDTGLRLREPFQDSTRLDGNKLFAISSKKSHPRKLTLSDYNVKTFKDLLEHNHRPEYWSRKFLTVCKAVGIEDRHFHNLRHTFITRTYYETGDIYLTMARVGHRRIETTIAYSKFDEEDLKEDFWDIYEKKVSRGDVAHLSTLS